jgi:hypothetical protein
MTCTERIKLLAKFISNAGIDLISVATGLFVCIGAALWLLSRPWPKNTISPRKNWRRVIGTRVIHDGESEAGGFEPLTHRPLPGMKPPTKWAQESGFSSPGGRRVMDRLDVGSHESAMARSWPGSMLCSLLSWPPMPSPRSMPSPN